MKNFNDFLKEGVDFRLGGSANKGEDRKFQNAPEEIYKFLSAQNLEDWEIIDDPYQISAMDKHTTASDLADSIKNDSGYFYSWHDEAYNDIKFSEVEDLKVYTCSDVTFDRTKGLGADLYLDGDNVILFFVYE